MSAFKPRRGLIRSEFRNDFDSESQGGQRVPGGEGEGRTRGSLDGSITRQDTQGRRWQEHTPGFCWRQNLLAFVILGVGDKG